MAVNSGRLGNIANEICFETGSSIYHLNVFVFEKVQVTKIVNGLIMLLNTIWR